MREDSTDQVPHLMKPHTPPSHTAPSSNPLVPTHLALMLGHLCVEVPEAERRVAAATGQLECLPLGLNWTWA